MIRERETPNPLYRQTRKGHTHEVLSKHGVSFDDFNAIHDDMPHGAFWALAQTQGFDLYEISEVYGMVDPAHEEVA